MPSTLDYPIIVHCHLRWDGVWQRPQQFLSRLAANHQVLFVEGPVLKPEDIVPGFELHPVSNHPNVTVMRCYFPASRFQDGDWVDEKRFELLNEAVRVPLAGKFEKPVQWFYDPMAVVSFANRMNESAIVYDCMDQLSQFKFAPPELIQREKILLQAADVVFCGGRRLLEAKSKDNANCHFYGCGVDVEHFATARSHKTVVPPDVRDLAGPIFGYFGVVDERIDYDLVAKLADANPSWNVVMIGPVVKVDPATLPTRPNLYWLGRREYSELPAYTKAFSACLMPFALNEATEYINPTKALEYMATARPVISTAVPDVISNFSAAVKIASSPEDFVELCGCALEAPDAQAIERGLRMADENRWESIVRQLDEHVRNARRTREARQATATVSVKN